MQPSSHLRLLRHLRLLPLSIGASIAALTLAPDALAQATVTVDPAADVHVISPLIYGMNFPSDAQIDGARLATGRWGGNTTTRYNYEIDVWNTGADYYFENLAGCFNAEHNWCASPPADPKEASGANEFLSRMKAKGLVALFTIPTMGWVAKAPPVYAHPFVCGCPKTFAPSQNSFDPFDANCGDGLAPGGGSPIACPAPTTTSVATSPAWAKDWVTYLVSKFGPSNGQRVYALDNEPALWSSTHRDIRTQKLGYDELWQRMRDYAVAILEADPTAEIAGPAEWGWPNYLCSDADNISQGCSPNSPDRKAHGGQELVAWLLDQAKSYEQANGKRILHYLDLHYYPQGGDPPEITRSLWDPGYTDPSWINEKIRLLPRMREWTQTYYPGTKIAVSEYDFYHHNEPVGAVTYATVLGLFGREGLDMATAWAPPGTDEAAFAAYKLFRNFDGKGGQFEGVSVRAAVSGQDGIEAFASVSTDRMTVAVINGNGGNTDVTVDVGSFEPGATAALYGASGGGDVQMLASVPLAGTKASFSLPGTSIAMLVIDGKNPNDVPDGGSSSSSSGSGGPGAGGSGGVGAGGSSGSGGPSRSANDSGCGCKAAGSPGVDALWITAVAAGIAGAAGLRRRRRM